MLSSISWQRILEGQTHCGSWCGSRVGVDHTSLGSKLRTEPALSTHWRPVSELTGAVKHTKRFMWFLTGGRAGHWHGGQTYTCNFFSLCAVYSVSPSIFLFFSIFISLSCHPFSLTLSHSIYLFFPLVLFFPYISPVFSFFSFFFLLSAPHPNPHPFYFHMRTRNLQH